MYVTIDRLTLALLYLGFGSAAFTFGGQAGVELTVWNLARVVLGSVLGLYGTVMCLCHLWIYTRAHFRRDRVSR